MHTILSLTNEKSKGTPSKRYDIQIKPLGCDILVSILLLLNRPCTDMLVMVSVLKMQESSCVGTSLVQFSIRMEVEYIDCDTMRADLIIYEISFILYPVILNSRRFGIFCPLI
ncbi:uncharacterized protein isoform X1 [Musca autumnalis]|uniref:uncharacterized protein isoform X1 n=1 Tax=Musca autumnalis TaxID=221902 RepID=UPI003CEB3A5A